MSVLAKSVIWEKLDAGEIFEDGSWDEDCIRSAAYDLRIAPDYLIAPDGRRYWPDDPDGPSACRVPFWLKEGEVAFVSTVEKIRMPPDMVGNIAQKFSVAREGILVQGGLLVDPGYGMVCDAGGGWVPKRPGERLHFQLANIGDKPFRIIPGKTSIAGIQFLTLGGELTAKDGESVETPNSDDLLDELFGQGDTDPLAPLAFFSRTGDLPEKVEGLEKDAVQQRAVLDSTRRSTEQLLVFGVFLVSITLFTVAVAALIDAIAGGSIGDAADAAGQAELTWPGIAVGIALLAVVGVACVLMMRPVYRIVEAHWSAVKTEGNDGSGEV